ncbi:MAG TPA: urate hydroxylase PuuD [Rhodanobacteraceae bacterium]|nr:urate hydroxylase PuuD [Rhodanobacteraceae bacterium]
MDFNIDLWLNLVIRWFHVMAGIMWIGTSFFFIWLDNVLQPLPEGGKGHVGKAWLFHGGGFYQVDKALTAPQSILNSLHWFKWEAYLTWLSGFALLIVVYWWHAGAYMVDPSVAALSPLQAVGVGVATLIVGWLVYDSLWRWLGVRQPTLALVLSFLLYVAAAWALTHLLSGRAAFIMSGALLGTLMAGNVAMVIMPNQRKMYAAATAGGEVDPRLSYQAKRRSTHNNYLTLPVIFMMISNHFSMTWGHAMNWLILVVMFLVGIGIDHFLNSRDKGRKGIAWVALALAFAGLLAMIAFTAVPAPTVATPTATAGDTMAGKAAVDTAVTPVAFAAVQGIFKQRCVECHSLHPSSKLFAQAPLGVKFDTPIEIKQHAAKIKLMTIDTQAMPLGNLTQMTAAERATLAAWLAQGAAIPAAAAAQ